ncbi:unnamed protein product [Pylaiella littoralis]
MPSVRRRSPRSSAATTAVALAFLGCSFFNCKTSFAFLQTAMMASASPTPPSMTAAVNTPRVLVTGGCGFIGSHTCVELIKAGEKVVVVDDLSNSVEESLNRVRELTECDEDQLIFRKVNLLDRPALEKVFDEYEFDSCVHFAGLKAVGESVDKPLLYYRNNIEGTLNLVDCMKKQPGCRKLVFSSSATVYGEPEKLPLDESCSVGVGITNPYGRTKYMIEEILRDMSKSDDSWDILLLRYFNPIGAHESGRMGEDPGGIPNNLMPFVAQVCVGRRDFLSVFGDDYDTPDGTGVRDYIHVVDLAEGHVAAVERLRAASIGCSAVNLGTGVGYSVMDVVKGMEEACGNPIPYKVKPRRAGDVEAMYADPSLAKTLLSWETKRGLKEMCDDTWRWQSAHPNGYSSS